MEHERPQRRSLQSRFRLRKSWLVVVEPLRSSNQMNSPTKSEVTGSCVHWTFSCGHDFLIITIVGVIGNRKVIDPSTSVPSISQFVPPTTEYGCSNLYHLSVHNSKGFGSIKKKSLLYTDSFCQRMYTTSIQNSHMNSIPKKLTSSGVRARETWPSPTFRL